jgi:Ca2+-binding EF-hand superfamily protein
LSQYLVDFSYFRNTNQLTESELEDIKKIFNVEMRKNNIDYKNITSLYYRTEYQILSIMEEI